MEELDSGCDRCSEGWICEEHHDQPWPHGECGVGIPCPVCWPEEGKRWGIE